MNEWKNINYKNIDEPQYKYINAKIFTEELLYPIPTDYKFHVYDGVVKYIQIILNRFNNIKKIYLDRDWNNINCQKKGEKINNIIPTKPKNLKEIIKDVENLSDNLDYVRVDIYIIDEKVIASELTFTPDGATSNFTTKRCDDMFSKFWKI